VSITPDFVLSELGLELSFLFQILQGDRRPDRSQAEFQMPTSKVKDVLQSLSGQSNQDRMLSLERCHRLQLQAGGWEWGVWEGGAVEWTWGEE
jgi:hypothetical protein